MTNLNHLAHHASLRRFRHLLIRLRQAQKPRACRIRVIRHFLLSLIASAIHLHGHSRRKNPTSPHLAAGLKRELIEGITEADFLRLGDKPKTVRITLVASFTADNSGMNFNGYSRGAAVYTIPVGWEVEVTFINPSPVPHSAILVEVEMLRRQRLGDPAIKGAAIPNPVSGISSGKAVFRFIASEPGNYGLACGIPPHASSGHWIALKISETAKTPTLKLGEKPVREAAPAAPLSR